MGRIAIFMAEGTEECESLITLDMLRRAGLEADLVSTTDSLAIRSSHNVDIVCDRLFDEVDFDEYEMLIVPGGLPGTPNLHAYKPLVELLKDFAQQGKLIAAICAGPSILAEEGLLRGVNATSNPGFQHILAEHDANLLSDAPCVVDGNFITAQGMGCAIDFGYALVEALGHADKVDALKKGIVDLR